MTKINEKYFRQLIKIMIRNLGMLEKSEFSCCGVTLGQCHAIVEIGLAEEISLNELADLLNLDNSTMSRTVNNLVNQGMAERTPHPEDRRYLQIKLTSQGGAVFRTIEESMNRYFTDILTAIPEEKRPQVMESLELLVGALKNIKCCI